MKQPIEILLRHGYPLLFAMVLAEQIGLPLPSAPVLMAMGALIGFGKYSFVTAVTISVIACLIADVVWYAIGRIRGASVLKLLCRVSLSPDSCVSSTRQTFKKMGGWALVVAKFVPGLSTVSPPMAGMLRMPWWKFAGSDGLGSFVWAGGFLLVGYIFRAQLEDVGALAERMGGWLLVVIGVAAGVWIFWKYYQRERFIKSLRIARITPEEVLARLGEFVILDLRTPEEVSIDGMKLPGALWFDRRQIESAHPAIPRDRDVVLYCT